MVPSKQTLEDQITELEYTLVALKNQRQDAEAKLKYKFRTLSLLTVQKLDECCSHGETAHSVDT